MRKFESFAYAHDVAEAFYPGRLFYFCKGRRTCYTFVGAVVEYTPNGSQHRLIVVSTVNEKTGVTYKVIPENDYRTTPVVVY